VDDFPAVEAARDSLLVMAPWSVFAQHLRLLEETDLELLRMPMLVVLEDISAGLATLRQKLGFCLSLDELNRMCAELARRIRLPYARSVRAALERFSMAIRAHASSPRAAPFPAAEALGLALSLEAGTLHGNLLPLTLGRSFHRAYLSWRCQLMAQQLRCLALDDEFYELQVTHRPPDNVFVRALRRDVGVVLAAGILDHVSCVIATSPDCVSREAALKSALELGIRHPEVVRLEDSDSPELRPAA
jgi:hypothetical protein